MTTLPTPIAVPAPGSTARTLPAILARSCGVAGARACAAAMAMLAVAGCAARAEPSKAAKAPPPIAVVGVPLERRTISTYVDYDGQVQPYLQSSLATDQAGTIVRTFANEGDRVTRGEALAKLDDGPLRAQLTQQQGSLAQAQAKLQQSVIQKPIVRQQYASGVVAARQTLEQDQRQLRADQAALKNADLVLAQNDQLVRQGYVSVTAFAQARSTQVAAAQAVRIDEARDASATSAISEAERNTLNNGVQSAVVDENVGSVTTARGNVDLLRTELAQTTLVAPYDGVVTERLLDPGAYAGPNAAVFQLSQISPIYVTFNVRTTDLAYVRAGTPVAFTTPTYPGRQFAGAVHDVNVAPTAGTLLYRARVVLPNADAALRPGLLVSVRAVRATAHDALVAPHRALVQDGGSAYLYAIRPAPAVGSPAPAAATSAAPRLRAVKTTVTTGLETPEYTQVEGSGLREGSEIVAASPDNLHDGSGLAVHRR